MELRRCGRWDLRLSALGLGCWEFGGGEYWGEKSQDDVDEVVRRAVDLGVTYFDVAEVYNDGRSEESLGKALRGIPRGRVIIGTKISPNNTEPATLAEHCDASLRRLGTDFIDLYMVHWPITPAGIAHYTEEKILPSVPGAFAALTALQETGKIRHIGVSNFGIERLEEARRAGAEIAVNQLPYSLLSRAIEREILPYCRQNGIGVIVYTALQQGLLTGKYRKLDDVPRLHARTRHFDSRKPGSKARHREAGAEEETERALSGIGAIGEEQGIAVADLALRWAVYREGITCVLAGSANPRHLEQNAVAAAQPLPAEVVSRLDAVTAPLLEKLGPSFDYYENPVNDRTR